MQIERLIPEDLPKEEVLECIKAIEEIVRVKWLTNNKKNRNELKVLWKRIDYLATIELYTLGYALKQIKDLGNQQWLDDFCSNVKGKETSNLLGSVYETIAFSMFSKHHNAQLAPPNQEGFDFSVAFGEKRVNISCKKLQKSDREKEINNHFLSIEPIWDLFLERRSPERTKITSV